jgi:hypothetical protein
VAGGAGFHWGWSSWCRCEPFCSDAGGVMIGTLLGSGVGGSGGGSGHGVAHFKIWAIWMYVLVMLEP